MPKQKINILVAQKFKSIVPMKKGKKFSRNRKSECFLIVGTNNKKFQSPTKEHRSRDPALQVKCETCIPEMAETNPIYKTNWRVKAQLILGLRPRAQCEECLRAEPTVMDPAPKW